MNFENLKNAWAEDTKTQLPTVPSNSLQRNTTSVIARIRRNIKNEFIAILFSYLIIIVVYIYFSKEPLSMLIAGTGCFLLIIQSIYYYSRFYIFYRRTSSYDLSLKKSIRNIVYELELNIEIYKTYSFCAMPLAMLVGLSLVSSNGVYVFVRELIISGAFLKTGNILIICVILLVSQVITAIFLNLHIHLQYGKYLKELKKIMYDFESDE